MCGGREGGFVLGVAGHHCEMNFMQFASYFVATVSIQEKQRHRSSRKGVRSSEMIREISNNVDSVTIFGSRSKTTRRRRGAVLS